MDERFFLGDHVFVEFGREGLVLKLGKRIEGKAALFFTVPDNIQDIPISNVVLPAIREGNEVSRDDIEKYLSAMQITPGSRFFDKKVNFKKAYLVEKGVFSTVAP